MVKWNEAESLAKDLFCIWKYDEDFEWLKKNWNNFHWVYKDKAENTELKIKLFALANLYYEFCHQAYDITYEILVHDITPDKFPHYHIQKLLKKHNLKLESGQSFRIKSV